MKIYIDTEFDAIKDNGKYKQRVISIGAVLVSDQYEICSTFYQNIRPKGFKRLSKIVSKMTNLTDIQILNANSFSEVIHDFYHWIQSYTKDYVNIYCFGPDDIRTLVSNCKDEHMDSSMFDMLIDIQTILSNYVTYCDKPIASTLSLDDLKLAYAFTGGVEHNALSDAMDLMKLHQAYVEHRPLDDTAIASIVERKQKKAEEGQRKWMLQQISRKIKPYIDSKLTRIPVKKSLVDYLCMMMPIENSKITGKEKCLAQFVKRKEKYYVHIKMSSIDEYIELSNVSYPLFLYCLDELSKVLELENKKITCKIKKL